jgi:DNA invertase Pin-like site-specific DNA recombinase
MAQSSFSGLEEPDPWSSLLAKGRNIRLVLPVCDYEANSRSHTIAGMKQNQVVAYYRVSQKRQGIDGLGMAAQRHAVQSFLNGEHKMIGAFEEVETGARRDRPQLNAAIELCRRTGARLVIARLDRLARNAAFVLNLRDSGVDFVAVDMPAANKLTIGILALVAEQEREDISTRTKAALAAARRRGVQLGNPKLGKVRPQAIASNQQKATQFAASIAPVIKEIERAGVTTLRGIAQCLNARGFKTRLGKPFTRQAVARIQERLSAHG